MPETNAQYQALLWGVIILGPVASLLLSLWFQSTDVSRFID